jgi:ABC-2 type transport system permease protein
MKKKSYFEKNLYLLKVLVSRNIRNQYSGSFLGALWTVLNPLLNMIVMALVFTNIFGASIKELDYPVYVLAGNIVFNFFRGATEGSLTMIVDQRDLLSKTKVPLWIFPFSRVGSDLVTFGFSYIALIIVMLIRIPFGVTFNVSMILVIAMLPALILFSLGFSLFLSSLYVSFRDIKHFYAVILTLWMYLTPLFYSLDTLNLGPEFQIVMELNPMYHFVQFFRSTLTGNLDFNCLGIGYIWGIVIFGLGLAFFYKRRNTLLIKA